MKEKTLLKVGGLLCILSGAVGFSAALLPQEFASVFTAMHAMVILTGLLLVGAGFSKATVSSLPSEKKLETPTPAPLPVDNGAVLDFLSLLQGKGRFVDFVMDDIAKYPDAQVGAAARVVHEGCASVMREHFEIVPVGTEEEGKVITLEKDYNPTRYRLVGRVTGQAPFRGTLLHRGWMTKKVSLPKSTSPAGRREPIIAPAEVELS